MSKKMKLWFVTLIILLLGIGVFFITSELDFLKFNEKMDTDVARDPESAESHDSVASENGKKPLLIDQLDAVVPSENVPKAKTKTEYASEVKGYEKDGVEGMYVTHIPRDPSRFAHLPPPPLPPSAVPEDCPEHLNFRPEWIDGVYRGAEPPPANDQFTEEIGERIGNILLEIVREHNPKRPYAEIWDQFIEYEKMYRAYAEWELGFTPSTHGAWSRLDWMYKQTWAFPEFTELLIAENDRPDGEEDRFVATYEVAMGILNQDWNKITLKDGRDFFIKGNSRYEFSYSGVTEDGNEWGQVTGFSRVRLTDNTPVVHIDVYNTSNEELEAMMGWDYKINPITMRPLAHDSSHVPLYPRFMEAD